MDQLTRRFSPFNLLILSINGMVGSAWLFSPLYAAKIAGSGALIAWLIGGISTVIIAMTFAELSALLPIAGGTTRLSQLSHGGLTSFFMSYVAWLSSVTMPPIEVQAVLQYSATYFPNLIVPGQNNVLTAVGFLWATILMLILSVINVSSQKGLVRCNFLLFTFKVGVIAATIGCLTHTHFQIENFAGLSLNALNWPAILSAVASGGVAFAFTGFKHGVELAGESKNPKLSIPLAIVGSVVSCMLLYIGLQIAFIGALQSSTISNGWQSLSFSGDAGPFVGIATLLGLVWLAKILYIDAIVSPLGAGLIYATSTARIIFAMGKNASLPLIVSRLNRQNFPYVAIAINFMVGMFLFLPLPGWQAMVSFLVSSVVLSYAMGPISLLCLRQELPTKTRPFKLPAATFLCFFAFYFCNLISYWTGWETLSKLAIALLVGALLFARVVMKTRDKSVLGLQSAFWLIPYLAGMLTFSYLGSFGGSGKIPFGWDFLIIAIYSAIVLYLAIKFRAREIDRQYEACHLETTGEVLMV